jgi:hypothetical protein
MRLAINAPTYVPHPSLNISPTRSNFCCATPGPKPNSIPHLSTAGSRLRIALPAIEECGSLPFGRARRVLLANDVVEALGVAVWPANQASFSSRMPRHIYLEPGGAVSLRDFGALQAKLESALVSGVFWGRGGRARNGCSGLRLRGSWLEGITT